MSSPDSTADAACSVHAQQTSAAAALESSATGTDVPRVIMVASYRFDENVVI
jgi:hypothetical protein